MSKSLGNFTNLLDLIDEHDPRAYRLLVLRSHYRAPIEVSKETIADAEAFLERLDRFAEKFAGVGDDVEPDAGRDRAVPDGDGRRPRHAGGHGAARSTSCARRTPRATQAAAAAVRDRRAVGLELRTEAASRRRRARAGPPPRRGPGGEGLGALPTRSATSSWRWATRSPTRPAAPAPPPLTSETAGLPRRGQLGEQGGREGDLDRSGRRRVAANMMPPTLTPDAVAGRPVPGIRVDLAPPDRRPPPPPRRCRDRDLTGSALAAATLAGARASAAAGRLPPASGSIWTTVALDLVGFGMLFAGPAPGTPRTSGASPTQAGLLVASFSLGPAPVLAAHGPAVGPHRAQARAAGLAGRHGDRQPPDRRSPVRSGCCSSRGCSTAPRAPASRWPRRRSPTSRRRRSGPGCSGCSAPPSASASPSAPPSAASPPSSAPACRSSSPPPSPASTPSSPSAACPRPCRPTAASGRRGHRRIGPNGHRRRRPGGGDRGLRALRARVVPRAGGLRRVRGDVLAARPTSGSASSESATYAVFFVIGLGLVLVQGGFVPRSCHRLGRAGDAPRRPRLQRRRPAAAGAARGRLVAAGARARRCWWSGRACSPRRSRRRSPPAHRTGARGESLGIQQAAGGLARVDRPVLAGAPLRARRPGGPVLRRRRRS